MKHPDGVVDFCHRREEPISTRVAGELPNLIQMQRLAIQWPRLDGGSSVQAFFYQRNSRPSKATRLGRWRALVTFLW